jgi:hypothetical protein
MSIKSINPTAESVDGLVATLRDTARDLERLAARMRATGDFELASDAIDAITNMIPNLHLGLLVKRPLREFCRAEVDDSPAP